MDRKFLNNFFYRRFCLEIIFFLLIIWYKIDHFVRFFSNLHHFLKNFILRNFFKILKIFISLKFYFMHSNFNNFFSNNWKVFEFLLFFITFYHFMLHYLLTTHSIFDWTYWIGKITKLCLGTFSSVLLIGWNNFARESAGGETQYKYKAGRIF